MSRIKRAHGYKDAILVFDRFGYEKELRRAVKSEMVKIKNWLYSNYRNSLYAAGPFKENEVKIEQGGQLVKTSDAQRMPAVLKSIKANLNWAEKELLEATFSALGENFKESHIGLYYEHGTGRYWDNQVSETSNIQSPNKYRTGREIVSRSRHIDYAGLGKGRWVDLGGNVRVTGSHRAGDASEKFRSYIGEDIQAHHWFSNVMEHNRKQIFKRLQKAIDSIDISKFFQTNDIMLGE